MDEENAVVGAEGTLEQGKLGRRVAEWHKKKREKDNAEARRPQRYAESWHAKARVPVLSLLNRFNHGDLMMTKLAGGARMRTFGGLRK